MWKGNSGCGNVVVGLRALVGEVGCGAFASDPMCVENCGR